MGLTDALVSICTVVVVTVTLAMGRSQRRRIAVWVEVKSFKVKGLEIKLARQNTDRTALRWLSDLVPGPRLRRRIRKMLADQEADIDRMRKDGRLGSAMWLRLCTWCIFVGMVLAGPVVAITRLISTRRSA